MHARTTQSLTTRHGPHDSDMPGQVAAGQWSSHTVDFFGCTSRGPLQLMVVRAVMQWFASLRHVEVTRAILGWASRSV